MLDIYLNILNQSLAQKKCLAILIDPDKTKKDNVGDILDKINQSPATHIFIGGSIVKQEDIDGLIFKIKEKCKLPILIFPGHPSQISNKADGVLFLSLLSGRNPEYLIEHHINSVHILQETALEIIPTAYILIDGGTESAVQKVSNTKPIARENIELAFKTAKASEYLGKKLIYLECGSGALQHVPLDMITYIKNNIKIPLIIGGGIRNIKQIKEIYNAGADIVVIGTAFEKNPDFFNL
jgi:phosphoglycerol geranylgeranyltransferase